MRDEDLAIYVDRKGKEIWERKRQQEEHPILYRVSVIGSYILPVAIVVLLPMLASYITELFMK